MERSVSWYQDTNTSLLVALLLGMAVAGASGSDMGVILNTF
ncbi:MAG: hypothetical protein RIG62_27460 [Cyclobacteriaceae bacterium]